MRGTQARDVSDLTGSTAVPGNGIARKVVFRPVLRICRPKPTEKGRSFFTMSRSIYVRTSSRALVEGKAYVVYGIRCEDGQDIVPDISTHPELVERMVEALNRCEVSPVHFREVLEDLLALYL